MTARQELMSINLRRDVKSKYFTDQPPHRLWSSPFRSFPRLHVPRVDLQTKLWRRVDRNDSRGAKVLHASSQVHERDNNLRSTNSNARLPQTIVSQFICDGQRFLHVTFLRWAAFGEYFYIPPQRWLHNLEHGSIVALYHPCANKDQVSKLKRLVKSCLYRHIITPYNKLSTERPMAVVGWGVSLEFSVFDESTVIEFIRKYAKTGPEKVSRNGQYKLMLTESSKIITDVDDSDLCPKLTTWCNRGNKLKRKRKLKAFP